MDSVIATAVKDLRQPTGGRHRSRAGVVWRVRPRPLDRRMAVVTGAGAPTLAAAGRAGIVARKREGDGATPAGRFHSLALLFRADRVGFRHAALPHRAIGAADGWCDDPTSFSYNRHVRLPAKGSHEKLRRDDELYHVVVVLDHNQRPRVRGAGSAVFAHVARPGLTPTAGCLAFDLAEWRRRRLHTTWPSVLLIGRDPRPVRRRGATAALATRSPAGGKKRGLW